MDNALIIGPTDGYRGTQKNLLAHARAFRVLGLSVAVLSPRSGPGCVREILRSEGFRVADFGTPGEFLRLLEKETAVAPPEFVNVHAPGWHVPGMSKPLRFLFQTGIPVFETNVFGRLDYFTGRYFDAQLHVSLWCLSRWNAQKRFLPETRNLLGVYFPNIVDTEAFRRAPDSVRAAWRMKCGIPRDAFILGRIGNTDANSLLPAVAGCLRRHPNSWFVSVSDVVGRRDVDLAWLPADVRSRCLEIPEMDSSADLATFYSSCNLLISTSPTGESFGYSIAESCACETPVVVVAHPEQNNAQLELVEVPELAAGKAEDLEETIERAAEIVRGNPMLGGRLRNGIEERYGVRAGTARIARLLDAVRRARRDGRTDRRALRDNLRRSFTTDGWPTRVAAWRHTVESASTPPSLRARAEMAWRWNPFLHFLYERLRVAIKHRP